MKIEVYKKGYSAPLIIFENADVNDKVSDFVICNHEDYQETNFPKSEYDYVCTSLDFSKMEMAGTQKKIADITDAMKDLLLYKNEKYGDSAINPNNVFYKGDSLNSILIRLDDKIGRIKNNKDEKPRVNDVCDVIGYCTLLLISLGVTQKDIEAFKD